MDRVGKQTLHIDSSYECVQCRYICDVHEIPFVERKLKLKVLNCAESGISDMSLEAPHLMEVDPVAPHDDALLGPREEEHDHHTEGAVKAVVVEETWWRSTKGTTLCPCLKSVREVVGHAAEEWL